jgi:predicted RNA-binding Zn ribbon-like protein
MASTIKTSFTGASSGKQGFAGTIVLLKRAQDLPFIAGHVALDFVNTAEERGHPDAGDALETPSDLRRWGERYGVLGEGPAGEPEFRRAIEARELLYRLLFARVHGHASSRGDVERLAQLVAEAYAAGELDRGFTWLWPRSELSTVRHLAVTSAVELLRGSPRLKQCPGERCGWFFLDATKRGNRRWCSMGECGQDAKTARRRERRRAS